MRKTGLKTVLGSVLAGGLAVAMATSAMAAGKISGKTERQVRKDFVDAVAGKTVAYVPITLGVPLSEFWKMGIGDAAKAAGMNFVVKDPAWNISAMTQVISALISDKVDYLVVQNPDVQVLAKQLKKAEESGIHVIQLNMASNYRSSGFVGVDWVSHGEEIGEDIVKECGAGSGKSGKVSIVQGELTAAANVWFNAGVKAAMAKDSTIKIVNDQAASWDATKAHDITATVLQQHPDLCATVGVWGIMMLGAGQAVKEAGLSDSVTVYGSGSNSRPVCDALESGILDKHYSYDSVLQGRDVINAVEMLAQSGAKPGDMPFALYSPIIYQDSKNVKPTDCYDVPS